MTTSITDLELANYMALDDAPIQKYYGWRGLDNDGNIIDRLIWKNSADRYLVLEDLTFTGYRTGGHVIPGTQQALGSAVVQEVKPVFTGAAILV